MNFLHDLALAHQRKEGWKSGSLTERMNNPGALRYQPFHAAYGAVKGDHGFAKFPNYDMGFRALQDDLRTKITGQSRHEKLHYENNPTFLSYIEVYAPKEDGNDPLRYAIDLILMLPQYDITIKTLLEEIARKYILPSFIQKKLSPEAENERLKKARFRALRRFEPPFLTRLLNRIDKRLRGPL